MPFCSPREPQLLSVQQLLSTLVASNILAYGAAEVAASRLHCVTRSGFRQNSLLQTPPNAMQTARLIAKMATQLAQIPEVERLSPRVIRILAGNPGKVSISYPVYSAYGS